jgi:dynein light chain roadblock-type
VPRNATSCLGRPEVFVELASAHIIAIPLHPARPVPQHPDQPQRKHGRQVPGEPTRPPGAPLTAVFPFGTLANRSQPANGVDSLDEALQRLSKKPGVKAWLMLDRTTGAVIKTNGQIAAVRPPKSIANSESGGPDATAAAAALTTPTAASFTPADTASSGTAASAAASVDDIEALAARELGAMVWGFLSTAGSLVEEMDTEVGFLAEPLAEPLEEQMKAGCHAGMWSVVVNGTR